MPIDLLDFGEEFQPGKALEVSAYSLPKSVWLRDGRLLWERGSERKVRTNIQTFQDFLNLFDAQDQKILAFAKRWGPLDISGPYAQEWMERRTSSSDLKESESCDKWRRLATIAGLVLEISLRHRNDERGKAEQWLMLGKEAALPVDLILPQRFLPVIPEKHNDPLEKFKRRFKPLTEREMTTIREKHGMDHEKWTIEFIVNEWLRIGDVRPALTLEGNYDLTLAARGLFGSLAVQLLELVGGHMLAACSGCRRFFHPKRSPRVDQDRFCEPCSDAGVPIARAKQRLKLNRQGKAKTQEPRKKVRRK